MSMGTQDVLGKTLGTQFEFTYNVFKQNTAGIDHESSLKQPDPAGNCMNWVGGHLVTSRCGLLELMGQEPPVWDDAKRERYSRGSAPLKNATEAASWDEIVAALDESQERLRAGVAALTPEQLLSPLPEDKNPFQVANLAEMLGVYAFHEGYHVGQLGVIRRTYGMDGAIN